MLQYQPKWEYTHIKGMPDRMRKALSVYGDDGWEAWFKEENIETGEITYELKRRVFPSLHTIITKKMDETVIDEILS